MDTPHLSDETLDDLRTVGDPRADELVATHQQRLFCVLRDVLDDPSLNGEPVSANLPPWLRAYLDETAALPDWADPAQIAHGQHLFGRYGLNVMISLCCATLPESYAAVKGANVLYLSMRMRNNTHRRVLETAQFVLDVMAPGALGPEGRGVRTAQKVRLVHAVARATVRRRPAYQPEWGCPINQEDQLGTLLALSVVVTQSLKRLGVTLTRTEEAAYLHTWLVIGHLLGVGDMHMPQHHAEALALSYAIRRRHHGKSEAGRELTRALLDLMEEAVPGRLLDGFTAVLMRHLVGDEIADLLEIPREDWTRALLWPFRMTNAVVDRVGDSSLLLARATETLSRKFLEGAYAAETGGEPVRLSVPTQLAHLWRVQAARPMPAIPSPQRF